MKHFIKQILTALTGVLSGIFLVYGLSQVSISQAQTVTSCDLINYQDQMVVFFAPMDTESQVKDILLKDDPYTNIGFSGGFFQITYGNGEQGWVRFHTRIMNGACTTYIEDTHPVIPMSEFPTVCLYTIEQELSGYTTPDLTQLHPGFGYRPAGTYAVTEIIGNAVGLAGSPDMDGGYVDGTVGTFSGHCDGTLQLATALDNARVWTDPDATTGQIIATLDAVTQVGVIDGPVSGNIQENLVGDWYQITKGDITGWVWSDRLVFGRTFTTPQTVVYTARVNDNARLWSEPNAKSGVIITAIPAGTDIAIIGEPQTGFIQLDSDLTGNWYPVQFGGTVGWLYEGRINFQ